MPGKEGDVSSGDYVEILWGFLGVNLIMDYRAGRERQVQCPRGQFRKDGDQCFNFPIMCC